VHRLHDCKCSDNKDNVAEEGIEKVNEAGAMIF
jgi:hypothetical protein